MCRARVRPGKQGSPKTSRRRRWCAACGCTFAVAVALVLVADAAFAVACRKVDALSTSTVTVVDRDHFPDAAKHLTVLTSTNPVPTNPSTDAIQRIFKSYVTVPGIAQARKLICFDEPWPGAADDVRESYLAYKKNVAALVESDPLFNNTELIFNGKWLHLAGTLENCLGHVATEYVLVNQHDLVLSERAATVDIGGILATLRDNAAVKHIRLNWKANDVSGHDLIIDAEVPPPAYVPLARTFGFSDRTHICRKAYYSDVILPAVRRKTNGDMLSWMEEMMQDFAIELAMWQRVSYVLSMLRPWVTRRHTELLGTYLYGKVGSDDGRYVNDLKGENVGSRKAKFFRCHHKWYNRLMGEKEGCGALTDGHSKEGLTQEWGAVGGT